MPATLNWSRDRRQPKIKFPRVPSSNTIDHEDAKTYHPSRDPLRRRREAADKVHGDYGAAFAEAVDEGSRPFIDHYVKDARVHGRLAGSAPPADADVQQHREEAYAKHILHPMLKRFVEPNGTVNADDPLEDSWRRLGKVELEVDKVMADLILRSLDQEISDLNKLLGGKSSGLSRGESEQKEQQLVKLFLLKAHFQEAVAGWSLPRPPRECDNETRCHWIAHVMEEYKRAEQEVAMLSPEAIHKEFVDLGDRVPTAARRRYWFFWCLEVVADNTRAAYKALPKDLHDYETALYKKCGSLLVKKFYEDYEALPTEDAEARSFLAKRLVERVEREAEDAIKLHDAEQRQLLLARYQTPRDYGSHHGRSISSGSVPSAASASPAPVFAPRARNESAPLIPPRTSSRGLQRTQ